MQQTKRPSAHSTLNCWVVNRIGYHRSFKDGELLLLKKLVEFSKREFPYDYEYFYSKCGTLSVRMDNLNYEYSILIPWIEKVLHLTATNQMFGAYSFFKRKMLELSETYWPDNRDEIVMIGRVNMEV